MRICILNTDYFGFLTWLYARHPGLEEESYDQQMAVRNESLFGVADFYSRNLRALGHEAWDLHANNEFMQAAWARERGHRVRDATLGRSLRVILEKGRRVVGAAAARRLKPLLRPLQRAAGNLDYGVLEAQVRHLRPDVLLNQSVGTIGSDFLRAVKSIVRLTVGQIASPLPAGEDYRVYDLMISSLPNLVGYFRERGVPAELHRFGFEPSILRRLQAMGPEIPVSFVGSLSPHHTERVRLLERVCDGVGVDVWGHGIENVSSMSSVRARFKGIAWGIDMYQILHKSKITLNNHLDLAGRHANSMRLFEATGVGACLVTDAKDDLAEMFEPDREVVTYTSPEECLEKVGYLIDHEPLRISVARAGQARTLNDHTYRRRMDELAGIVGRHLGHRSVRVGGPEGCYV